MSDEGNTDGPQPGTLGPLKQLILEDERLNGGTHIEISNRVIALIDGDQARELLLALMVSEVTEEVVMDHYISTKQYQIHEHCGGDDTDDEDGDDEIGPAARTDVDSGRTGEMRPGETRRYSIPDGKGGYLREVEWLEQEGLDPTVGGSSG